MLSFSVDEATCIKCGLCAASCPGLVSFREGEHPRLWPGIRDEMCSRCGHCVAICPTGSLKIGDVVPDLCKPIDAARSISIEQCAQHIESRRSVREFLDRGVPGELIERIVETARYAPTACNRQEVGWLVVDDRAAIRRLAVIGADWLRWAAKNMQEIAEMSEGLLKGLELGFDGFLLDAPALVLTFAPKGEPWAAADCVLAAGYFDLAAKSAGLGCCWGGLFLASASTYEPMMRVLALPEGCAPYGCLMLGYPRYEYRRIPQRKKPTVLRFEIDRITTDGAAEA
ncbi:MAG: nitroreductase family protein [Spirochaetaceae bacterium]|nr:nitroreductase family protein [Spirochaetaceae bacterium]